jgi:hypothetical protein
VPEPGQNTVHHINGVETTIEKKIDGPATGIVTAVTTSGGAGRQVRLQHGERLRQSNSPGHFRDFANVEKKERVYSRI